MLKKCSMCNDVTTNNTCKCASCNNKFYRKYKYGEPLNIKKFPLTHYKRMKIKEINDRINEYFKGVVYDK